MTWPADGGLHYKNLDIHVQIFVTYCRGGKSQRRKFKFIVWTYLPARDYLDFLLEGEIAISASEYILGLHNASEDIEFVEYNKTPTIQHY